MLLNQKLLGGMKVKMTHKMKYVMQVLVYTKHESL